MSEGVDFSWGRPTGKELVAAGKHFVVRYLPYHLGSATDSGKGLSIAEIRDYRANGLAIVANFEWYAERMKHGRAGGITDATAAQSALNTLGMPHDLPVYFSADWNATSAEQSLIDAYLRGAASVLGAARIGVYGSFAVISRCRANASAKWFWQTYAWSAGRVATWAHLYQYHNAQKIAGEDVDLTRSQQPEFGQWKPPAPVQTPTTVGEIMQMFGTPSKLTMVPIKDGATLYDNSSFKQSAGNVTVHPGREFRYLGTPNGLPNKVRMVAYEDDDTTTPTPAFLHVLFARPEDVGQQRVIDTPATPDEKTAYNQAIVDASETIKTLAK